MSELAESHYLHYLSHTLQNDRIWVWYCRVDDSDGIWHTEVGRGIVNK